MCGRFTLVLSLDEIEEDYHPEDLVEKWNPSYNISPSQFAPVLVQDPKRQLKMLKWGQLKTFSSIHQTRLIINIRKETLTDKHSFDAILKTKRCIIPASGFYEWKKEGLKTKKNSFPYYFYPKNNRSFAFAGLWDENNNDPNLPAEFAIITCPANEMVGQLHERMPVILDRAGQDLWLNNTWEKGSLEVLRPFSPEKMEFHMVTQQVNNPSYNSIDCISAVISQQPKLNL